MTAAPADSCGAREAVHHVAVAKLTVTKGAWPFAARNAEAIAAHWAQRQSASPALFDGRIHLLARSMLDGARFTGRFLATDFKSFLYWRDQGHPDPSVRDAFGSAIVWSADGRILLGRQRAGNINAGKAYLPGGFIDPRDVGPDNTIDIDGSVAREIAEETGLDAAILTRLPGYLVTECGPLVSIAVAWRAPETAAALTDMIQAHIARDPASELTEVHWVDGESDLAALDVPAYARRALAGAFAAGAPWPGGHARQL